MSTRQLEAYLADPPDERSDTQALIDGSAKLSAIFGAWPSFRDAEVLAISLWRGDVDPDRDRFVFPVLTTKIHLWQTDGVEHTPFGLRRHTLATLRFRDVEDLSLTKFNHQNALERLTIGVEPRGEFVPGTRLPPYLTVALEESFGVAATFKCLGIEVVSAVPCTTDAVPLVEPRESPIAFARDVALLRR